MSLLHSFSQLLQDPPPAFAFELSEAGVACVPCARPGEIRFRELEPGIIAVSPSRDNVQRPEILAAHVASLFPQPGPNQKKRRTAAWCCPTTPPACRCSISTPSPAAPTSSAR